MPCPVETTEAAGQGQQSGGSRWSREEAYRVSDFQATCYRKTQKSIVRISVHPRRLKKMP
jgi:hypothetical protein